MRLPRPVNAYSPTVGLQVSINCFVHTLIVDILNDVLYDYIVQTDVFNSGRHVRFQRFFKTITYDGGSNRFTSIDVDLMRRRSLLLLF